MSKNPGPGATQERQGSHTINNKPGEDKITTRGGVREEEERVRQETLLPNTTPSPPHIVTTPSPPSFLCQLAEGRLSVLQDESSCFPHEVSSHRCRKVRNDNHTPDSLPTTRTTDCYFTLLVHSSIILMKMLKHRHNTHTHTQSSTMLN